MIEKKKPLSPQVQELLELHTKLLGLNETTLLELLRRVGKNEDCVSPSDLTYILMLLSSVNNRTSNKIK